MPGPNRSRGRAVLAALATLLLLIGVSLINKHRQHALDKALPTPAPAPVNDFQPAPLRGGLASPEIGSLRVDGTPIDLAAGGYLLALTKAPSRIYRLAPQQPLGWVAERDVDPGSYRLVLDGLQLKLYLLGHQTGGTSIRRIDPLSLATVNQLSVPFDVRDAVASFDTLWLATDDAVYSVPISPGAAASAPRLIVQGAVQALAIDELDERVMVALASSGGTTLRSFAFDSDAPGPTAFVRLDRVSLAVVSDDVWVAGTGPNARGGLLHFDSATLHPRIAGPYQIYGITTEIWPGDLAVWVAGDAELVCLARSDGALLASSDVDVSGRLVTAQQFAFALDDDSIQVLDVSETPCYRG